MRNFKYPIGRYQSKKNVELSGITGWIEDIDYFRSDLEKVLKAFTDPQLKSSLMIIKGIHRNWIYLLEKLGNKDLDRVLNHPGSGIVAFKNMINHYACHGKHHLAHITSLKKRNNWS